MIAARLVCVVAAVSAFLGLAILDALNGSYRTAVTGFLLAIVNYLYFTA